MQSRCLLTGNTEVLHKAVISILDMCLHFSGIFTSYAGDTTAVHDVSRQSITIKHRSRRLKRQQRNVIGFSSTSAIPPSASFHDIDSSDDDYAEGDESTGPPETSFSVVGDPGYGDNAFESIERMSKELDGLVRFVRRGVESLSGGAGEEAATFGVLAFALEDWDL
jgi:gamma-tubulin complex component 5